MNDRDLLAMCLTDLGYLSEKEVDFIISLKRKLIKPGSLTLPQGTYLQACYDKIIACKYNLDNMSKPYGYYKRKKTYGYNK